MPPWSGHRTGRKTDAVGLKLGHITSCVGVALRQSRMRLQAPSHRLPMGPILRLQFDPVEALLHAPCHFLVQPW